MEVTVLFDDGETRALNRDELHGMGAAGGRSDFDALVGRLGGGVAPEQAEADAAKEQAMPASPAAGAKKASGPSPKTPKRDPKGPRRSPQHQDPSTNKQHQASTTKQASK